MCCITPCTMSSNKRPILSKKEVSKVVKRDLQTRDFELIDYIIENASESPMGFLGEHKKIKANVKVKQQNKQLIYFVKKTPSAVPSHREYLEKIGCFYKEIGLYRTLFEDLKAARKVTGKIQKWHPDYYFSRGDELFVIEDLSLSNYYMYQERTLLDEEHVMASLEVMAAMHAASIIFEEKFNQGKVGTKSEKYVPSGRSKVTIGDIYSHLLFETEATEVKGHPGNTVHEVAIAAQTELVDYLSGFTPQQKQKIKRHLPDRMRRLFQLVKPSDKFKNVVVHGDLWANNLLFRRDKNNQLKAVIIDFQLARYAPPAHDVMTFLHLVQSRKFRDDKKLKMLKHYYGAFSAELENNGLDADDLLPLEEFLASCDHYDELGILTALFFFQLILAPADISSKFLASADLFFKNMLVDRRDMVTECFLKDKICSSRITESFNELITKLIRV